MMFRTGKTPPYQSDKALTVMELQHGKINNIKSSKEKMRKIKKITSANDH